MLAKKTSKNQLTLPKDVVKLFPDTEYFDVTVNDNKIILMPVRMMPAGSGLDGVRDKLARLGITKDDVAEAVAWARGKRR